MSLISIQVHAVTVAQPFVPKVDKEQDVVTAEVEINDSPTRLKKPINAYDAI